MGNESCRLERTCWACNSYLEVYFNLGIFMTIVLILMFLVLVAMFMAIFVINSGRVEELGKQNIQMQLQLKAMQRGSDENIDRMEREIYRYIGENNKEVFQSIDLIAKEVQKTGLELKEMVMETKDEKIPKLPKKRKA